MFNGESFVISSYDRDWHVLQLIFEIRKVFVVRCAIVIDLIGVIFNQRWFWRFHHPYIS